jgi:excinuclease ABC subunit C
MAEVLRRRLTRGLAEDDLPDLIVIDGGRGQLGVVVEVMSELSISTVDVVGLAKARSRPQSPGSQQEFERIFRPGESTPIVLPQMSPEQHLLTRIRDEAHRFAITYHRRLKSKTDITSLLEQIPGIGPQRSRTLLREFGSVSGVREASDDALCAVSGMTADIVDRLRIFFAEGGHLPEGQGDSDTPISQPPSAPE